MPHANFLHGRDLTITRANIAVLQGGRARSGLEPLTADEITRLFVRFPEERHFERVRRLMRAAPAQAGRVTGTSV